jgi:hypothetical protein
MIYDKASLVQIPSGYRSGTLYSVVPNTADGDFTVTGDPEGEATRVNKDGLIETVAADVPRLDYPLLDGVVQDCPALLLEPSRTNRITDTEGWGGFSVEQAVLSDNTSITAPDGSTTGIKTLTSSSTSQPRIEWRGIAVPSTTTTYVWSVFVKKGTTRYVALSHFSDGTQWAVFDLDNGVIQDEAGSDVPAKIENYGGGWFRISKGATITTGQSYNIFKLTIATPSSPSTGVSGETVNIWGFQIEIGLYLSSFIPTTTVGSITTRTADTCNIANYTNLPTDYPLTVYWKGQVKEFNGFNCAFSIYQDGSSGGFLTVSFNTSSQILVRRAIGGSEDVDFISHSYSLGDVLKIGIKFTSATTFKLFIDGLEIYEETSGVSKTWDFNSVLIGQLRVAADTGNRNPCDALMLFNEALSDSELETITSYTSFNQMAKALLYTIE